MKFIIKFLKKILSLFTGSEECSKSGFATGSGTNERDVQVYRDKEKGAKSKRK